MKTSFILYTEYADQVRMLSTEQRGKLLTAIFDYAQTGTFNEDDKMVQLVFSFIRQRMDRDAEKYESTCQKRKKSGAKGGMAKQANASKCYQLLPNASKSKQNLHDYDSEFDSDSDSDTDKPKTKRKDIPAMLKEYSSDPQVQELLNEWYENRKAKRAANTENAIRKNLDKLQELAKQSNMDDRQYLSEIVRLGWTAFYPIRQQGQQKTFKQMDEEREEQKYVHKIGEVLDDKPW